MSQKIRCGWKSLTLDNASNPSSASRTSCPPCLRNISALRLMVLLSSITKTLSPELVILTVFAPVFAAPVGVYQRAIVMPHLSGAIGQSICEPFQSLPCAHHIQDKSSSWGHQPIMYRQQCHLLAHRSLRRKSIHRSSTSRSLFESQLKLPSHRMQQLYRGSVAYSRKNQNLVSWQTPPQYLQTHGNSKPMAAKAHRSAP